MKTIAFILFLAASTLAFADSNQPPVSINNRLDAKITGLNVKTQSAADILEILLCGLMPPDNTWNPPIHLQTNLPPEYVTQLDLTNEPWPLMRPMNIDFKEISFREAFDAITEALDLRYEVTETNLLFYIYNNKLLNKR